MERQDGGGPSAPAAGAGGLVLVGTPIGNLGDLSPRAVEALRRADVILCEDTRRTRILLTAAGVTAPRLEAVHAHNEAAGAERAVRLAAGGSCVAVVTDAGMPGISDPGARLVRAAVDAGLPVTTVPGPTAAVSALVLSGLAGDRWCFEGFLPRRGGERAARLRAIAGEARTSVIYEAPHRVARTLRDLAEVCGPDRRIAFARELTKRYEEIWHGTVAGAATRVGAVEPRGEWVLVVEGAPAAEATDADIAAALAAHDAAGTDRRRAVRAVTEDLGVSRRRVYDLALARKADNPDGPAPAGR